MSQTIPSGVYFGFTLLELKQELIRYKNAVKESGSDLLGASVNGQSFNFGPRRDMSLTDWQQELQAALAYFGWADDLNPPQTAIDFRRSGYADNMNWP